MSYNIRAVLCAVLALVISGCVITKTVNLKPDRLVTVEKKFSASEISVTAPRPGEEILVFADYLTGGTVAGNVTVLFDNYKRADFKYNLTNDIKPGLHELISSIYKLDDRSKRKVTVAVNFKYYIPSTGSFSNTIGIAMKVHVKETENGEILFEELHEINETEAYSTFPVTYPREDSFRSLYTKALNTLIGKLQTRTL